MADERKYRAESLSPFLVLILLFCELILGSVTAQAISDDPKKQMAPTPQCNQILHPKSALADQNQIVFSSLTDPFGPFLNSYVISFPVSDEKSKTTISYTSVDQFVQEQKKSKPKQNLDVLVKKGLWHKVNHYPHLVELLTRTDSRTLIVYHNLNDAEWGDGADGQGANKLGAMLMDLRHELQIQKAMILRQAEEILNSERLFSYDPSLQQKGRTQFGFAAAELALRNPSADTIWPLRNEIEKEFARRRNVIDTLNFQKLEMLVASDRSIELQVCLRLGCEGYHPYPPNSDAKLKRNYENPELLFAHLVQMAVRNYKPQMLNEFFEMPEFTSEALVQYLPITGLNALEYAKALHHQDLFDMMVVHVPKAAREIRNRSIESYFPRFSFAKLDEIKDVEVATGPVTEEMFEWITPTVSIREDVNPLHPAEYLRMDGHLSVGINGRAAKNFSNEELTAFLEEVNRLAISRDPKDIMKMKLIDPEHDRRNQTYFYRPLHVMEYDNLLAAARLSDNTDLLEELLNRNRLNLPFEMKSHRENREEPLLPSIKDSNPLLISKRFRPFPHTFWGLTHSRIYALNGDSLHSSPTTLIQWYQWWNVKGPRGLRDFYYFNPTDGNPTSYLLGHLILVRVPWEKVLSARRISKTKSN